MTSDLREHAPGKCLNCGADATNSRSLYCSERCRQIAELVRYARRKLAEGTYERSDIAEAIFSRKTLLAAGEFYDKRGRAVSAEDRRIMMERANGCCEQCGRKFGPEGDARFTVQHTATEAGWKLEAWCYRCNIDDRVSRVMDASMTGLRSKPEPASVDPEIETTATFFVDFDDRIRSLEPMLLCDDQENWPAIYREIMSRVKKASKKMP